MSATANLALPFIEGGELLPDVTLNETLRLIDTLLQLAIVDRDLNMPPGSPSEGQRWIVKASPSPTGAWAGHGNHIAAWQDGGWVFCTPRNGWLAYLLDESALIAWNGTSWIDAGAMLTTFQNLTLLGIGTMADATNPLSAKLNNALWVAKTVAEGGDGHLRYKLSKESAAKTLSLLLQTNFSGRAEIGLTGDDDFHFKVSADGSAWTDALLLDRTTGSTKVNSGFFLTGDITPAQITADQNDYNPTGLASAAVLRLSSDASRAITGLSGGGDGRVVALANVGANPIVLKNENGSSSAGNRFALGANARLNAKQACVLWYDAADSRWKLVAGLTAPLPIVPGCFRGLTIARNATTPNTQIDIAPGTCCAADESVVLTLVAALTKKLDASFAAGSGNGGLDTGTKTANTTYHAFLIYKPSDGSVDALLSASASSPTMPSGYTASRYLWPIMTDGSGNIRDFSQLGNEFRWTTTVKDVQGVSNPGTSAVTRALTVPTGVKVFAQLNIGSASPTDSRGIISSLDETDQGFDPAYFNFGLSNAAGIQKWERIVVRTDTSGQIRTRNQYSDASTQLWLSTAGYIFPREAY